MKNVLLKPCDIRCTSKKGRLDMLALRSIQTLRILALVGVFCLTAFTEVSAQRQVEITGSVKDGQGLALPGVSIQLKGGQAATSTNFEGNFSISVPATGTLVFSYLGYTTQEIAIAGQTSINVSLAESTHALDEVVVVALGATRSRRGLVSSLQEVKGDEFTQARDNNIATALTGKIAGLDAAQINAGPGSSSKVTIRGANLINGGNNQPLYVIDGMPIQNPSEGAKSGAESFNIDRGDGISMINPDDIETISVLKGGAAAALYGSQAANGVIMITTKKGRAQDGIGIDINSVANVRTPSVYPVYQYVYGQGQPDGTGWTVPTTVSTAQASGRLSFGPKIDPSIQYIQVDGKMHPYKAQSVKENINNFYDTATDITNSVAFSGGNEHFTSRLSLTDLRSNAQQPNSTYDRQGGVLTTSAKLGKNNIVEISGGLNYTIVNGKNRPNVGYAEYSADWPIYLVANTVDIRSLAPGRDATGKELSWNLAQEAPNPYFVTNYMQNSDKSQRFIMNGDIKVNLLKNLFVRLQANRDYQMRDYYNLTPLGKNSQPNGTYASSYRTDWSTNIFASVNYNTDFLKDFHTNITLGGIQQRNRNLNSSLEGTNWIIPDFFSTSNLGRITTTAAGDIRREGRGGTNSAYGSVDLDYKSVVYLSLTGRNDWFSQLNRGSNSIFYPSIGTSIILSEIFKMPEEVNMLKVRGSWARVGLANVTSDQVRRTYSIRTDNIYGLPALDVSSTLLNPTLRPLKVDTWETGFETSMLGNRLGLDVTYYNKTSHDDILPLTLSRASGFRSGLGNLGSIQNKGVEAILSGTPVRSTDFTWSANLNFTLNRSKVIELAPTISEISLGTGIQGPRMVNRVGLPYSTLMGNVKRRNEDGQIVYSKNDNMPRPEEVALGVGYQPYLYGLTNDFRYKRFSLNIFLDGKFGGVGFTNLEQYATRFGLTKASLAGRENGLEVSGVDEDGQPYQHTYLPGNELYNYYNKASRYPGDYVHSTDFVKLRRLVLSYNIPVDKLKFVKIKGASFSIVGSNLLILYQDKAFKDVGIDPELQESSGNGQGTGGVSAPHTRVFGANLRVSF